ncbi:unnamed protein product [Cunninghamella echinulata]
MFLTCPKKIPFWRSYPHSIWQKVTFQLQTLNEELENNNNMNYVAFGEIKILQYLPLNTLLYLKYQPAT